MNYETHKDYFKTSYQNGVDIWTHLPSKFRSMNLIAVKLAPGAKVLDVGSGRGLLAKHLAEMGFTVTGIDFESEIVAKVNEEIPNWGLQGRLELLEADVFHLPFPDASFDGVCDVGLLENLYVDDWALYAKEINRVLKPGGYYLNMVLSRKTKIFLDFSPINSTDGEYDSHGVHYHFFEEDELQNIFTPFMNPISSNIDFEEKPRAVALLQTLFQKK